MHGGDPEGVGVEEEEEDHAEGHEIHVDQEEDSTVIEAPASLHATNGVRSAGGGGEGGEDEDGGAVDLREAGEEDGCEQTGQDKQNAAWEGSLARIEKAGGHTVLINLNDSMLLGLTGTLLGFIGGRMGCLPALLQGREWELAGVEELWEAAGFLLRRWLPLRLRCGRE